MPKECGSILKLSYQSPINERKRTDVLALEAARIMGTAALAAAFLAFLVYVAVTPRHKLEHHLFLAWGVLALSFVYSLAKGLVILVPR